MINTAVLDTVPVHCIQTQANKLRSCVLFITSAFVHKFAVKIKTQSHKLFNLNSLNMQHTEHIVRDKAVDPRPTIFHGMYRTINDKIFSVELSKEI
jgi:hypothetical protein